MVHNHASRTVAVVLSYAETNGGAGWALDRSGPLGPEQDWGEIPGRGSKSVRFRLTERQVPWRVHVWPTSAPVCQRGRRVAIRRIWAKLRLGADAGRGPQLVEDRYLGGGRLRIGADIPRSRTRRFPGPGAAGSAWF